jgi:hypothetical protein
MHLKQEQKNQLNCDKKEMIMKNKFVFEIGEFDLDLYGIIHTFYKDFDNIEKAEDFCFNKSDDSSKYLILSEKMLEMI